MDSYLLLLLSDSNLPTGGFIASSGLESFIQHGFLLPSSTCTKPSGVLSFLASSLHSYAHLNLPFVSSTWEAVAGYRTAAAEMELGEGMEQLLARLKSLDDQLEAQTLNVIARRASTAQGVALLTLYERAFASEQEGRGDGKAGEWEKELVLELRNRVREGMMKGHLSIGFGVLTALLGLSLDQAYFSPHMLIPHFSLSFPGFINSESTQHLFLFLHARSILSSSVRMNTLGPYVSHRLLLHEVQPLVAEALLKCGHLRVSKEEEKDDEEWGDEEEEGPTNTWPLGEILVARHGALFSKIFNS